MEAKATVMKFKPVAWAFVLALLTGCTPHSLATADKSVLEPPPGAISARELAYRLRLTITDASPERVVMRDTRNVVSLYADPGGQAYVNGQPVGAAGGIASIAGAIYLPQTLEPEISLRLGRAPVVETAKTPRAPRGPKSPAVAAAPAAPVRVSGKVMIDAGHGGKDPGARSTARTPAGPLAEKDINLAIALGVAKELQTMGVTVIMTRSTDTFIELADRYTASNRAGVDLFLALHCDSIPTKPDESGFACWLAPGASASSLAAADAIAASLGQVATNRGHKRNTYQVLIHNARPAVLLEMGFLSNAGDATRLGSSTYQQTYAKAIAAGVAGYLKAR